MNRKIYFITLLALLAMQAVAQQLYVGTYNIRYKNESYDSRTNDQWSNRYRALCAQINFESPDVFGAQEVLHEQLLDMLGALDDYGYIGVGRDDGKEAGEYSAIFYKRDRLELLDEGHFWLNETPDKPALGWDAACIRICTWGKFKDLRCGRQFYFFTLHMDHVGGNARREAAKLVMERIGQMASPDDYVVLTGDFNVDQNDEIHSIFLEDGLLKDTYSNARIVFSENGTWNGFVPDKKDDSRIDHIFVSAPFRVEAYGMRTDSYWIPDGVKTNADGTTVPKFRRHDPSDHYPVFAKLFYK